MSSSSSFSFNRGKCNFISLDLINHATNNFAESNFLGKGGEGKVYLANINIDSMQTPVAVKLLKPNSTEFDKEIRTMSKIQHNNIVSLLGYCDESGQKILIYEYMENGSLSKYVKNKSQSSLAWLQRLRICLDAARGLQHLHVKTAQYPKGIIHRDIKPDNILLGKDWIAKISDFGIFKVSEPGQVESVMDTCLKGTSGYFAPEYISFNQVTRKTDVYAFGVVLFQVLCQKMPWDRGGETYIMSKDEDFGIWAVLNVDPKIKADISDDSLKTYAAIIRKSLKKDQRNRPNMDDVVLQLEKALMFQELRQEEAKKGRGPTSSRSDWAPSSVSDTKTLAEGEYGKTIVLDIGECITKAGFAGDAFPQALFSSLVVGYEGSSSARETFTEEPESYSGFIREESPVKDGIVVNWAAYEEILHYALYNELDYHPEHNHPVLLTEPPLKHNATDREKNEYKTNREEMIKLMFEKFEVPAAYVCIQPVLSLFAHGLTTGLVIESGEGVSHSVPIYEGHVLPHGVTSLSFAGCGIKDHLTKIINEERDLSFSTQSHRNIVQDVKEKMAYVALNYNMELENSMTKKKIYTLPDGKLITVGQELFQSSEVLFDPSIVGMDQPGIHQNTYDSLVLCYEETRDELCQSIVLSGGSTMLSGFSERMEKEMRGLVPSGTEINILAHPKRNCGAWIGGSMFASLDIMDKMWITRKEYEEHGPSIVHKKCF